MTKNTQKKTTPVSSVDADVEQPSVKNNNISITEKSEKINSDELQILNMDQLLDTVFPPRVQIVETMLDVGTYLFVGSPKVGKSFFMAQLGYSISKGIPLWGFRVTQGDVLYLALEDTYARLQRRLATMHRTESTDKFHVAVAAKKLNDGLRDQLENFMAKHKETKLIVIDTLKKIRDKEQEQYSYNSDYEIIDNLKGFAEKHNICLLIVHHTRKQSADDIFDTISGSNGLLGAADGAFVMSKKNRITSKATMDIVGRDNPDQRLRLEFNREEFIWELVSVENEILEEPKIQLLEDVDALLTIENPIFKGSANELIDKIGNDEFSPTTITRMLNVNVDRLMNDYGITLEYKRNSAGRKIILTKV